MWVVVRNLILAIALPLAIVAELVSRLVYGDAP